MNPVIHFEIPVLDIKRATEFYEVVFGHKLARTLNARTREPGSSIFPFKKHEPGASGILFKSQEQKPARSGVMIYFATDDLEAALCRVVENGGTVVSPNDYHAVTIEDTEGNLIGIIEKNSDHES